MTIQTIYGFGGYCENCASEHDHPLHNIISIEDLPDEST